MEKEEKIEKLRTLLDPAVQNRGAFLVDLAIKGDGRRQLLEVFCETERGITIGECAEISREVLPLVETSGILGESFRLDVSSPGVGEPLKDRRQYKSNIGRGMSVKYTDAGETKQVEGDLVSLTDGEITLKTETASIELGFDSIMEARVKLRW
jgi:ribosome maturation factor RimP